MRGGEIWRYAPFRTLEDVHRFLAGRISRDGFPVYRAAVTAGLAGGQARQLFKRMETWDTEIMSPDQGQKKLHSHCSLIGTPSVKPLLVRAHFSQP